jgi:hypothetical protein
MKRSIYKSGILLSILVFLKTFGLSAEEISKEYHKEYSANENTTININNKYGDVVVQSWDKNQVTIDVKVTVELPNNERAQKLIEYITVEFSETGNIISAKTNIDDKFNFSGWGDSRKFSIDYNVKMPANASLSLINKYGDANIDELHGLTNLDVKYGNISIGKLTRGNIKPLNRISLAYGKGTIDEASWLDIMIRYSSKVEITRSQALLIDSKYSKLYIGEASSVVGESKYDNIRIDKINNLVLDNGYTETNIGTLNKKLDYKGGYGSFSVENIPSDFESVNIDTHYMGVHLGIESNADYKLEAKVRYGGLKYDENNFSNEKRISENNSIEITGVIGDNKSPSATVNVISSYGSVRLY